MFELFQKGPLDPMFILKKLADEDTSHNKVDLGVGIYRNNEGHYSELNAVAQAKLILTENNPGHDYELTTGNPRFLQLAAGLLFGKEFQRQMSDRIVSVQTISGTGANHLAALALNRPTTPRPKVFVGVPAWGNYRPMFELVGLEVSEYSYYDSNSRCIDFNSIISAAHSAPPGSIFVVQGCCHNPTGADPTREQWNELAATFKELGHFILLDIAYQGLGNGMDQDAYAVRLFASLGLEMFVCQSFSKNFALYGERCGVLHAVCPDAKTALDVHDRLRCLIRWEFSSSPAYGSRLVEVVLESDQLVDTWLQELSAMRQRMKSLREKLHYLLTQKLHTPGSWEHILLETGLFSYLDLTPHQCKTLIDRYHIYLPPNGRINVSGLNEGNIERVARAIHKVINSGVTVNQKPRPVL